MHGLLARTTLVLPVLVLTLLAGCRPKAEPAPPASTARDSADTTPPVPAVAAPSQPVRPAPQATPPPAPRRKPVATTGPTAMAPVTPAPSSDTLPVHDQWHPAARDTLDSDTYQGWKQFELNCSRCHGEYAVGSSFAPALVVSLKEGGTIPTKEAFVTTVCAGRLDKGMPSWCALGLEMGKIEQIYKYVKGRADGHIAAGRPALRE